MFLYKFYEEFKGKHLHMKKDITSLFVFIDDFCKKDDEFMAKKMLPKGLIQDAPMWQRNYNYYFINLPRKISSFFMNLICHNIRQNSQKW
ncbi:MAG: hypothetical protein CNLJKLNK_00775 [Holosporales bacterium]